MVQGGYSGWAIPRAAHNPTAALDFVDTALSARSAQMLVAHGLLPARRVDAGAARAPFQRDALAALDTARAGVYLDATPIPNFLASMEAHLQQLLAGKEPPATLTRTLQSVYASHGRTAQYTDTDGEF
jgi:ABC-type glycerol-3-phosphate transport system substrate-binding protein